MHTLYNVSRSNLLQLKSKKKRNYQREIPFYKIYKNFQFKKYQMFLFNTN